MAKGRPSGVETRVRRRWTFGKCIFDEANWSLIVDGKRQPIESKPLEILRQLLLRHGQVVSKADLLDAIWPNVTVVEASLPTAVRKLRRALDDPRDEGSKIETITGIGYRFAVPVALEVTSDRRASQVSATLAAKGDRGVAPTPDPLGSGRGSTSVSRFLGIAGAMALASAALVWGLSTLAPLRVSTSAKAPPFSQRDVSTALRKLDLYTIEEMIAAGWDPNTPMDTDRNGAINILLGNCEWDPGHDQRKLLLLARTLIDGGARLSDRNAWGDTAYSIATSDRYCGPDHPVTKMIQRMCFGRGKRAGNQCLADYRRDSSGALLRRF